MSNLALEGQRAGSTYETLERTLPLQQSTLLTRLSKEQKKLIFDSQTFLGVENRNFQNSCKALKSRIDNKMFSAVYKYLLTRSGSVEKRCFRM